MDDNNSAWLIIVVICAFLIGSAISPTRQEADAHGAGGGVNNVPPSVEAVVQNGTEWTVVCFDANWGYDIVSCELDGIPMDLVGTDGGYAIFVTSADPDGTPTIIVTDDDGEVGVWSW